MEFFKQFNVVLNGLDNLDARRHVNRLCLAADVPLVESGTTGFLGQVIMFCVISGECLIKCAYSFIILISRILFRSRKISMHFADLGSLRLERKNLILAISNSVLSVQ